jgi:hypothetical protein
MRDDGSKIDEVTSAGVEVFSVVAAIPRELDARQPSTCSATFLLQNHVPPTRNQLMLELDAHPMLVIDGDPDGVTATPPRGWRSGRARSQRS